MLRPLFLVVGVLAALQFMVAVVRPLGAQEIALSPNLANHLRELNVGLKSGRVVVTGNSIGRRFDSTTQSDDRREKITVELNGAASAIDYELATKGFQIALALKAGNALTIRRFPQGDSSIKPLEFNQPADGKITITVGKPPEKTYTVESLWHLMLADPGFVKMEIEPLLRLLRPGWPLASSGQEIEETLYKLIDIERRYDRQAWHALVEQLSGPRYVDRVEADRKLRELGQVVVPYLRNLNEKQLDAEQLFRIRTIVRGYGSEAAEDTGEAAAQWLAADPEIWYSLAARATAVQRQKIAGQLSLLLGEPVVLTADPASDEGKKQLAKIRGQIDRLQAATK